MRKIEVMDKTVRIYLSGLLTPESFRNTEKRIENLILGGRKNIILDIRKVTHMHYKIAASIDRLERKLNILGGELRLVCDNEYLIEIMRFATGEPSLSLYPNMREAGKNL